MLCFKSVNFFVSILDPDYFSKILIRSRKFQIWHRFFRIRGMLNTGLTPGPVIRLLT